MDNGDLTLQGISTNSSSLYPMSIAGVLGDVPYQLRIFHVLRELTKATSHAVEGLQGPGRPEA